MSLPAAFDAKEQVRQSVDIVDLLGGYLDLRRQGRNYVALCPWHDDSRPSLQVNPERQSWKCWVCDVGGDIFSFVMQREGVDFRQALEMLAERAGVQLTNSSRAPITPGSPEDKKVLYAAMAWAEQQWHRFLLEGADAQPARAYLAERGISDESIEKFHLGFAPNSFDWMLNRSRDTQFSAAVLQAVGLIGTSPKSGRHYDFFRGRVMFSIRDTQQRPIAASGRILPQFAGEKTGKYVNSPQTKLYNKSEQLYALDVASTALTKGRHAIVVEGQTDVIMAHQHGLKNVVAVCGTALGADHLRPRSLLRRYADRITLILDGDEAGQKRTNEILELFVAEQVDLRIATLPEGLDPCDYLQQRGGKAMQQLIDSAVDALTHKINIETATLTAGSSTHEANQALENILSTMAQAPRLTSGGTSAEQLRMQQMLARLARQFGVGEEQIRTRLNELRKQKKPAGASASYSDQEQRPRLESLTPEENELFELFAFKPQLVETAIEQIETGQLRTRTGQQLFEIYREIVAAGEYPDYDRVQTSLEDAAMKNLLAGLDWAAHDKAPATSDSPEDRLTSLVTYFSRRQAKAQLQTVHSGNVSGSDALELVRRFLDEERNRQGFSGPKDGS